MDSNRCRLSAVSPLVFGWILDITNPSNGLPHIWGWGFMALGVGGAIATLCALMLQGEKGDESKGAGDRDRTGDGPTGNSEIHSITSFAKPARV